MQILQTSFPVVGAASQGLLQTMALTTVTAVFPSNLHLFI